MSNIKLAFRETQGGYVFVGVMTTKKGLFKLPKTITQKGIMRFSNGKISMLPSTLRNPFSSFNESLEEYGPLDLISHDIWSQGTGLDGSLVSTFTIRHTLPLPSPYDQDSEAFIISGAFKEKPYFLTDGTMHEVFEGDLKGIAWDIEGYDAVSFTFGKSQPDSDIDFVGEALLGVIRKLTFKHQDLEFKVPGDASINYYHTAGKVTDVIIEHGGFSSEVETLLKESLTTPADRAHLRSTMRNHQSEGYNQYVMALHSRSPLSRKAYRRLLTAAEQEEVSRISEEILRKQMAA